MTERFRLHENLKTYDEFHQLATECLKSTDIVLRRMGTELSELALSLRPGDDSSPYYKLYELEGRIRSYIKEHGVKTETKSVSAPIESKYKGEPDLSNFDYYEFRTREEPDLPENIKILMRSSKQVYSRADTQHSRSLDVCETPAGQLLVYEEYEHDGGLTSDDWVKQLTTFNEGHIRGYAIYSISRKEFEANNRTADFKRF